MMEVKGVAVGDISEENGEFDWNLDRCEKEGFCEGGREMWGGRLKKELWVLVGW